MLLELIAAWALTEALVSLRMCDDAWEHAIPAAKVVQR